MLLHSNLLIFETSHPNIKKQVGRTNPEIKKKKKSFICELLAQSYQKMSMQTFTSSLIQRMKFSYANLPLSFYYHCYDFILMITITCDDHYYKY